jgi:ABC-type multidrug transport system permease subunit
LIFRIGAAVGVIGIEPTTSRSQAERSSRLSYTPFLKKMAHTKSKGAKTHMTINSTMVLWFIMLALVTGITPVGGRMKFFLWSTLVLLSIVLVLTRVIRLQ